MSAVPPGEVAPFIKKLREIVDAGHAVAWNGDGTTFTVSDVASFERYVLADYFKSPHMASFVRQLNFYGFRKMTTRLRRDSGNTKSWEFQHPYFLRDDSDAAVRIRRRTAADTEAIRSEGEMLRLDMASMRNKLALARKQLASAQKSLAEAQRTCAAEREARQQLEREMAALRQKLGAVGGAGWVGSGASAGVAEDDDDDEDLPLSTDMFVAPRKRRRVGVSTRASAADLSGSLRISRGASDANDGLDDIDLDDMTGDVAATPSATRATGTSTDGPSKSVLSSLASLSLRAREEQWGDRPVLSAMRGAEPRSAARAPSSSSTAPTESTAFGVPPGPLEDDGSDDASPFGLFLQPNPPQRPAASPTPAAAAAAAATAPTPGLVPAPGSTLAAQAAAPSLSLLPSLTRVNSSASSVSLGSLASTGGFGSLGRTTSRDSRGGDSAFAIDFPSADAPIVARAASVDSTDPWDAVDSRGPTLTEPAAASSGAAAAASLAMPPPAIPARGAVADVKTIVPQLISALVNINSAPRAAQAPATAAQLALGLTMIARAVGSTAAAAATSRGGQPRLVAPRA